MFYLRRALIWLSIGGAIILSLAILDLLVAEAIFILEKYYINSPGSRGKLHYWFQILSGNWSEQPAYAIPSFIFSLTISTSIILNFGPAVAIFGLIARIFSRIATLQQEGTVKLVQALAAKDEVTKQALYDLFSDDQETIDRINEGFKRSEEAWRPHLVSVIGRKAASLVFSMLNKEIPQPK